MYQERSDESIEVHQIPHEWRIRLTNPRRSFGKANHRKERGLKQRIRAFSKALEEIFFGFAAVDAIERSHRRLEVF